MLVIKDFATTILASALTAAATSVVVSDASRLPALSAGDYYYLVLQKFTDRTSVEVVKVTGVSGNTLTVVRAQAGTTAKSFAIGDYAEQRVTVGTFSEYIAQSVATKVDEIGGHVEQSLGLLNAGDLVKATVGISYDAVNGHGTILSGGEGANKVTPYVALRPLGVADSSVQLKYAQDGSLILSGGSRYVETGLLSMKHPQDANGWPNAVNSDANNYNNRARGKVHVNNNALYFIADAALNARRFGIQSGHEDPGYATSYGVLDLNPFGGDVRVNGGVVYHTNYVPTPAAVGALALSGGTITGSLDQNIAGYGARLTASSGYVYLQGGKVGGDTADQKLRISGILGNPLTEFDILTAGHGVAKANGARIYTEQYVPTPDVLGVVPQARTINSKPLTSNITLSAADVGALGVTATAAKANLLGNTNLNTTWTAYIAPPSLNWWGDCGIGHSQMVGSGNGFTGDGYVFKIGARDVGNGHAWIGMTNYGDGGNLIFGASYSGSAAPVWATVYSTRNKPTAADVGAVAKTGDTMTGSLRTPAVCAQKDGADKAAFGTGPSDIYVGNFVSNKYLQLKDDGTLQYSDQKVYHQGFKPTAADVGAMADGGTYGTVYLNNWIRTVGDCGWYSQTYGGGLYMTDSTWIRTYNGKKIHIPNAEGDSFYTIGGVLADGAGNFGDVYIRSDKRLKTNLVPLSDALEKVCKLTGYEYDKKKCLSAAEYDVHEAGLIAQDVQAVLPAATSEVNSATASGNEENVLTISHGGVIALLVEAVKELSEKVKELEHGRT